MEDSGNKLDLLPHALRQFNRCLLFAFGQFKLRQPIIDFPTGISLCQSFQPAEENELVSDSSLGIKPTIFRQVADPILKLRSNFLPQHRNISTVRRNNIDDHSDGGRLTRPIRPKEAKDRALRNFERKISDSQEITKLFGYLFEYNGVHCNSPHL